MRLVLPHRGSGLRCLECLFDGGGGAYGGDGVLPLGISLHGEGQAPSIAASRMAVTCGLGLNGAMASAINMLDDIHGGAGEQAVELYIA